MDLPHQLRAKHVPMTRNLTALFAITLAAVSCSHGVSRIQTRSLPASNPTTYSFPLPLEEVRTRALQAFSIEHQVQQPIFGHSTPASHLESVFAAECATNAVFGPDLFREPANTNDIFLHTFHTPFVISSVYHGKHGGLPFIASFRLHLADAGSNTTVSVIAYQTQVINGTKFGFGPCGPGQGWNCQSVAPTTVEEYSILLYLGRYLGITNMPAVIFPAQ